MIYLINQSEPGARFEQYLSSQRALAHMGVQ